MDYFIREACLIEEARTDRGVGVGIGEEELLGDMAKKVGVSRLDHLKRFFFFL